MATGAAAMMAIRVLLDHDVPEENIYLLALIMAVSGVYVGLHCEFCPAAAVIRPRRFCL